MKTLAFMSKMKLFAAGIGMKICTINATFSKAMIQCCSWGILLKVKKMMIITIIQSARGIKMEKTRWLKKSRRKIKRKKVMTTTKVEIL